MSARGIVITDCSQCPRKDHRGAYGRVAYLPVCMAMGRDLPNTQEARNGRVYAKAEPGIPEWCPLPKVEVLS